MKAIRNSASLLMLVAGVMHILYYFKEPQDANALPMLVFGIIYFIIGILLFLKTKFSNILGITFPLIGLVAGLSTFKSEHLNPMLTFLFAIDVVVIVCSIFLIFEKK